MGPQGDQLGHAKQVLSKYPDEVDRDSARLIGESEAEERRGRRRRRIALAAFAGLTALMTIAAVLAALATRAANDSARDARESEKRAQDNARQAEARARQARDAVRVARAGVLAQRDPTTALLLLREVEASDPMLDILGWWEALQDTRARWITEQRLRGHEDWVNSARFSPDGQRLVTASADNTARVWTLSDGRWTSQPLLSHTDYVVSAEFSPDGERVVTASEDKTARVWTRSQDGQWTSQPLLGHDDSVHSAAFSPDGTAVVTASGDNTARIWFLAKKDLIPRLWRATPDCLSAEERRQLLGEAPDTARANEAACRKCVTWYRDPDAEFPCPHSAYAD